MLNYLKYHAYATDYLKVIGQVPAYVPGAKRLMAGIFFYV